MARKRKEQSLSEAIAGLVMMIVVFAVLSPIFRGIVLSTLSTIFTIVLLLGVVGLVIYLIIQLRKSDNVPAKPTYRNPTFLRAAIQPAAADLPQGRSPEEEAHILEIIQSLQPVYHEQHKPTKWDDKVLPSIEWKRFEKITKEFLKLTGYEAHETKVGADGGVDIRVTKPGAEGFEGIVQCKAWNSYKVGVKPVRELFGVMAAEKVKSGMVITSGKFTDEAEDFARGKMTLISGSKFLELIQKLPEEKQQQLLDIALKGDYQTPTCPHCDIKMTLRESKKGRGAGGQFWGCVRYPRCKQTLVYKQDSLVGNYSTYTHLP